MKHRLILHIEVPGIDVEDIPPLAESEGFDLTDPIEVADLILIDQMSSSVVVVIHPDQGDPLPLMSYNAKIVGAEVLPEDGQ